MKNREELLKIAELYREGSYNADAELLRRIFHADCMSYGYINGEFTAMPAADYIDWISSVEPMCSSGVDFKVTVESFDICDKIASLTIRESGFFGRQTYIDNFQLMNIHGEWKIVSKLFTTVG